MRVIAVGFGDEDNWPAKYGAKFENDIFFMCPDYQDAECDCGFDVRAEEWHAANPCAPDCYYNVRQTLIRDWEIANNYDAIDAASGCDIFIVNGNRFSSADEARRAWREEGGEFLSERSTQADKAHEEWSALLGRRRQYEDHVSTQICTKIGIPWNDGRGSAVHCTCGKEEKAKQWFSGNDHAERCVIALPNFWFKPTGFKLTWYKYIGRDMEIKAGELPSDFMQRIFATHPKRMMLDAAIDETANQEKASRKSFAAIFDRFRNPNTNPR